jgi:hypothetical protein
MRVLRQDGIVSLMSTIIIGLLLMIITLSMTALMIGEVRQATDSDQSIKAYYAADSGVEDAINKIRTSQALLGVPVDPALDGVCQAPDLSASADLAVQVTCQRIVQRTNTLSDTLGREGSREVQLLGAAGMTGIDIAWNVINKGDPSTLLPPAGFPSGTNPWTYPAAIELVTMSYTDQATLTPADFSRVYTTVIRPGSAAFAQGSYTTAGPQTASCTASGADSYNCHYFINDLSRVVGGLNKNYVMRIKARYNGTSFKITPQSGGVAISVPDNYLTIDVTARAGDVYRRVVRKVPYHSGVVAGLEYSLFSDGDLCKKFAVAATGPAVQIPSYAVCPVFP